MKAFFEQKVRIALCSFLVGLVIVGAFAVPPLPTKAEPVSIAIATVTFVTVAVVAACQLNVFGICPPPSSGGSGGGGKGNPVGTITNGTTPTQTGNKTQTGNTGNTGGSGVGAICTSAPNAVCGITSQGTIVNGVCNATTPANSACPAPVIGTSGGFYADPSLVRSGNSSTLHWNVTKATVCAVTGGGLNLNNLGIVGTAGTGPVTSKTVYTLTCINGTGGPVSSVNTSINLVPNTTEQ